MREALLVAERDKSLRAVVSFAGAAGSWEGSPDLREDRALRLGRLAPAWLTRVRDCLHDRFLDPPSIAELAHDANVHPDYLARVFRIWFGHPIGQYMRRLRLDWAPQRLAATSLSIVQIALDAGFADQSHFTRAFKRYLGVAPGDYRRSLAR